MLVNWKITRMEADGELITHASYRCIGSDDNNSVETEGHWSFPDGKLTIPLAQVTEKIVADWIKEASIVDGKSTIEGSLEKQLDALKSQKRINLPWNPQIFTV